MRRTPALAACAALAACDGRGVASVPGPAGDATAQSASAGSQAQAAARKSKIKHVVIVVQENRSFDNLFQGYPGANTASSGKNSLGQTVALQPEGLEADYEINHSLADFVAACDGTGSIPGTDCRMDAFDKELSGGPGAPKNPEYAYVPATETKPYFDIAGQYVLADDMFTSHVDASFVSHQYIIAGQAGGAVDLPSGAVGLRRNRRRQRRDAHRAARLRRDDRAVLHLRDDRVGTRGEGPDVALLLGRAVRRRLFVVGLSSD